MARKFSTLRAKMAPAARKTSDREFAQLRAELPLNQLRQALKLSQQQIAQEMGVSQAAISLLENREDLLIGTLRRFIEAMGGELELRAKFPSGVVTLNDLSS
jgi:DNA-binding XRE family transcriptional regulator